MECWLNRENVASNRWLEDCGDIPFDRKYRKGYNNPESEGTPMANIIEITDFSDPALDAYARLTEAQLKNPDHVAPSRFIAESPKVVQRALDGGYRPLSMLVEGKHIEGEAREVIQSCGDIPVYTADAELLTRLTGFHLTRGCLCEMERKPLAPMGQMLSGAKRVAVLENVMNPTNVGAIFRSAAALGMDAVILAPGCSDPLYRRCLRVSMGTVFQVPWTVAGENWHRELTALGFQTAALALRHDTMSIRDPRLKDVARLALILGAEGDGLCDETLDACDFTVKIPMYHGVDSLNVAAASAVAFYELGQSIE